VAGAGVGRVGVLRGWSNDAAEVLDWGGGDPKRAGRRSSGIVITTMLESVVFSVNHLHSTNIH
jgi:hypothetical protein